MRPWVQALVCVAVPALWGLVIARLFAVLERRRRRADQPPPPSIDYTI